MKDQIPDLAQVPELPALHEAQQALERCQGELTRALAENARMRAELQAIDAVKHRFLAVLSHELRNPLASIDSAAALLLTRGLPSAEREAAAQVVKRQAGVMKTLLDDLLGVGMNLAQIEPMLEMSCQAKLVADRTRPAEPAPGPIVTTSAARGGAKPRGLILVADDNADAGWGLAKLLEIAGFATLRVGGGVDAVQETRRQKPDVGILDIGMPDLSGHEAARQIRQTDWGKHMVLIAATGWGQESDEREAIEAGFDAHMTKPVDLRKLSAVVEELLARKRS